MRLFQGFALAINMLSTLPFFKVHHFFKGINGYSAMLYPLVGFLLGLLLWGVHSALMPYLPPIYLSVVIFALWVTLTGALHLDGFSDTIDGLFVPKERALEVMKDSHVGGMGMIFTFVFLSLKLSALISLQALYLLPLILMYARLNAVLAIYLYPYVSSGVGSLLKEEFRGYYPLFALLSTLVVGYFYSFLSAFWLCFLVMLFIARFFTKRLGGLSGDIYGLIIELSELILLSYILVAYSL